MQNFVIAAYFISLTILFLFGSSGFVMIYYYLKHRDKKAEKTGVLTEFPLVTIQLPLFNEFYVAERLIDAACEMEYPRDRLEIQVLDDSTDETAEIVARRVDYYRERGLDIKHLRRDSRTGYKAGALKAGLQTATGEFIAMFDADFLPQRDFLKLTLPFFLDEKIGLVQTRWEHLNREYSHGSRRWPLTDIL
jgi:cellulose synthase/poly-beta-1,6-N-acetylglucosamine synthase-like glycosyltransferase